MLGCRKEKVCKDVRGLQERVCEGVGEGEGVLGCRKEVCVRM